MSRGAEDLARGQHGLVTRRQAVDLGLSERQIDGRLANGEWIRAERSVYRMRSSPPSWESRLLAAVWSSGGIASHRAAAALWGLDVFDAPRLEISVPRSLRGGSVDARIHRTTQWALRDEVQRRMVPTTGVGRTILDCGAVCSLRTVERLAEAAIRNREISWLGLADVLRDHSRRGRNGCLTLRRLLHLRLEDGTVPLSDFSRRVVHLLEAGGVPAPQLEHRILDDHGDLILQADLAWPSRKKAWELDGLRWHFGRTDVERDRRKRNRAIAQGWSIQEILWSMYTGDPDGLVDMAHRFLAT